MCLQYYVFLEIVNTSTAMMRASPNCVVSNPVCVRSESYSTEELFTGFANSLESVDRKQAKADVDVGKA